MLLDSNIIILAALPENECLRTMIAQKAPAVSVVSQIEVLGYHALSKAEKKHFEEFFSVAQVLTISEPVIAQAIQLRQKKNMSLGDALVAATALVHEKILLTHNPKDFAWIKALKVLDPVVEAVP